MAAFITPIATLSSSSFTTARTGLAARRPAAPTALTSTTMQLKTPNTETDTTKKESFSRIKQDREAKLAAAYRGPQGFTPYAERVNGRMAMIGFIIGLVTEAASGMPLNEQILYMFSPLTHALAAVLQLTN